MWRLRMTYPYEIRPGVWHLLGGAAGIYLVVGTQRAAVIDTGFGRDDGSSMLRGHAAVQKGGSS